MQPNPFNLTFTELVKNKSVSSVKSVVYIK